LHALLKKALLQEKDKAASAELKVKQLLIELHRKNEEQVGHLRTMQTTEAAFSNS
jgi:hypothetical protein